MTRIILTADLHYDIARSQQPTRDIAEAICDQQADALILLGDLGGRDIATTRDCLRLFDRFTGAKFFVAGNHDIWVSPGVCSLERFENELPRLCRETGFHPLDLEPAEVGGVGLVGSMGWYDYTLLPDEPRIPLRFYQAKVAPGAADRLAGYESLLARRDDVPEWSWEVFTRWMDGEHVRLPLSDEAFTDRLLAQLDAHLEWASRRCDRVVAALHHVPFRELVPLFSGCSPPHEAMTPEKWKFTAPYMGSARFGELLLRYPKVTHAYCGHTHFPLTTTQGHLTCVNLGCTYLEKRIEVLEV